MATQKMEKAEFKAYEKGLLVPKKELSRSKQDNVSS